MSILVFVSKVEKVLKGSLDSIPSPSSSVKIQVMGREGLKTKSNFLPDNLK